MYMQIYIRTSVELDFNDLINTQICTKKEYKNDQKNVPTKMIEKKFIFKIKIIYSFFILHKIGK